MAKHAHLYRPRGRRVKRIQRSARFEHLVRGVVINDRSEVVGRTSKYCFGGADPLLGAGVSLMFDTKVEQPMLVRTERLSDTRMSKQGGDRGIDSRLIGSKPLDRDAQGRMLIPVTRIAVAHWRATAAPVGMFATLIPRIVVHRKLPGVWENTAVRLRGSVTGVMQ
jgi:hypothetical protein